ncbi:MAG: type III polyketide synthase [Chitinivibrionales bacterium]|nr:type III polyketide synthase [Chitinivibrionales bacterium]MBD3357517.1 type III polyketide synthase [Chitinivibrionales bacterium]
MTQVPHVRIASIGIANPDYEVDQEKASRLLHQHYADSLNPRTLGVLRKVFAHPSVAKRHLSVENDEQLIGLKDEDPDVRIERFNRWAVSLSVRAAQQALDKAGVAVRELGGIVVNTCTGYLCPGISTYLIEKMGMERNIHAYDLVGSGCGGSLPNIDMAAQLVRSAPDQPVLCVAVEICSATFEMSNDMSLVISNAIFGDGAAAAVVWSKPEGLRIVSSKRRFIPEQREDVRYVYRGGRLHNKLSQRLPAIVRKQVAPVVRELLADEKLTVGDIHYWALHSGGDRMIESLRDELGLSEESVAVTREILRCYGNMSSPTALFALHQFLARGMDPGKWCVMIGYGAGMSVYAMLLKAE